MNVVVEYMQGRSFSSFFMGIAFCCISVINMSAAERTWDGGGADALWSTTANWDGSAPQANDYLVFEGMLQTDCTNDIPAATSFSGITFADGSGSFLLSGNSIVLDGPLINLDDEVKTVDVPIELTSNTLFNAESGDLALSSVISGDYGLNKSGGGRLLLETNNSFTGESIVSTGAVVFSVNNALGSSGSGTVVADGGWLEISGGITVDEPLILNGDKSTSYRGVLRNYGDNTWNGHITVNSSRVRSYNGTITLTGGISGSGMACLACDSSGTIVVSDSPIIKGSSRVYIHSGGLKVIAVSGNQWGSIENSGGKLRTDVPGALALGGDLQMGVSYSPNSHVNLNGNDQNIGDIYSGTTLSGNRELTSFLPATLTVNQTTDRELDADITGTVALIKCGDAVLTLSGTGNTTTGGVVVSNGTLRVASGSSLGFTRSVKVAGGTLDLQSGHSIVDSAVLCVGETGCVHLASGVIERVGQFCIEGIPQREGTWGASGSGSEHIDDIHFSGEGVLISGGSPATGQVEFYLSPYGTESGTGTLCNPFLTLERAVSAVRNYKNDNGGVMPAGGVTVWMRDGLYPVEETLKFGTLDSGVEGGDVVYRAYPGESPRLHGARILDPAWFTEVDDSSAVWDRIDTSARGNLVQVDLTAHGISDFGELQNRGFGGSVASGALELFFGGQPMQLARWPDPGENSSDADNGFCYTEEPLTENSFSFSGTRMQRWVDAEAPWLHGFWGHLWADWHAQVTNINHLTGAIKVDDFGNYDIEPDMPWYALNLLEEITMPGEWYLDRDSGILYFWPPDDIEENEICVSMLEEPMIQLNAVQHVIFRDLTFELSRSSFVSISGGSYNRVIGCTMRNTGISAATASGYRNGFNGCDVYDCGDGGISISGGSRQTLSGVENYVRNCTIHNFGRWVWTYKPAVSIGGNSVGHVVSHNHLYNAPHSAILFGGSCNYNRIDNNHIHDVCLWTSDAGAVYGGRDIGAHGSVIRNNFIHHISSGFASGWGTQGIYLDDTLAGIEVFGNICYEVATGGIQHGGGRDVVMKNNVLVKCGNGLRTDARGIGWRMDNGGSYDCWVNLQKLPYRGNVWSNAFPELYSFPTNWQQVVDEDWMAPENCVFSENIGWENDLWVKNNNNATSYFREVENNLPDTDPLFTDEGNLDLSLQPGSPAFTIPGFEDIPFYEIGPMTNESAELVCWSFPNDSERSGFSYEHLVNPEGLSSNGFNLFAVPGHPTWGIGFNSSELDGSAESEAVVAGDYIEFSVAPLDRQIVSPGALIFECRQSGGSPRAGIFVRLGADGFSQTVGTATAPLSNQWSKCVVPLPETKPQFCNPYRLRIYFYNPAPLEEDTILSIDNITLLGSAQSVTGSYTGSVILVQ